MKEEGKERKKCFTWSSAEPQPLKVPATYDKETANIRAQLEISWKNTGLEEVDTT